MIQEKKYCETCNKKIWFWNLYAKQHILKEFIVISCRRIPASREIYFCSKDCFEIYQENKKQMLKQKVKGGVKKWRK